MIKKIASYIFRKRAEKQLKETARSVSYVSYDKAKTILLLFESDFSEKNLPIRKIIAGLQQDGKKVTAWGFIDKKEISTSILPDYRVLHHQQTDFFHQPIASYINEIQQNEFDLLIDLTLKPIIPLQYLTLYAHATCKVGVRKMDLSLYDFMLDFDNLTSPTDSLENQIDETYLFEQIIFYLKSIQTKD